MNKKNLLILALILLVAVAGYIFWNQKTAPEISYHEAVAQNGAIEIKILATGTVQPENRIEIKPPVPGRVENVLIEEGQKVRKGQILAWMSSTERAALLDAARAKGADELKKWEEIYPPTPILAPLTGTIVLKNVEPGESFTNSDSLMSMSDRLTVKAQVDETDIASISVGQEANIVLDAYPDKSVSARVDKIAFDATTVNSVTTYIVDVLPLSVPDFMRSGMTANVTFFIKARKDVLLISNDAVKTKDGQSTVLIRKDGKEVEKQIVVGISDGKEIEVLSGLVAGDIVLSPVLQLEKNVNSTSPFNPMARKGAKK